VGSFWWKDTLKLFDKFKNLATCQPNKGNTVLFWTDIWVDQSMKDKFPQLFSFRKETKMFYQVFSEPINGYSLVQYNSVPPSCNTTGGGTSDHAGQIFGLFY